MKRKKKIDLRNVTRMKMKGGGQRVLERSFSKERDIPSLKGLFGITG